MHIAVDDTWQHNAQHTVYMYTQALLRCMSPGSIHLCEIYSTCQDPDHTESGDVSEQLQSSHSARLLSWCHGTQSRCTSKKARGAPSDACAWQTLARRATLLAPPWQKRVQCSLSAHSLLCGWRMGRCPTVEAAGRRARQPPRQSHGVLLPLRTHQAPSPPWETPSPCRRYC